VLSADERRRYSRHVLLPGVGTSGQERLKAARVLIVGAGGLGSPAALYLAAAGVGTLGLMDDDRVDVTNLQRQLLHGTDDVGRHKLDSARDRLTALNPHVQLETHATWLTSANAMGIIGAYDVVLDGTDNFSTRYLVNDACVLSGRPNVHGSVFQFDGQASVFALPDGPCYRCLYPEPPPPGTVQNCAEGGVFGVLPGLVGTIQAVETLKLLLGIGDTLSGRLLMVDALGMEFRTITIARDPQCPACGTRTLTRLIDYDEFCGVAAHVASTDPVEEITPAALAARLAPRELHGAAITVIDVREAHESAAVPMPSARCLPLGTLSEALAALDPLGDFVVVCRSGVRSAQAVRQMRARGFGQVRSLAGGMLAWGELRETGPGGPGTRDG
jgi:sulfur-carrier protein adenylyltransferase/sulfurtransferase